MKWIKKSSRVTWLTRNQQGLKGLYMWEIRSNGSHFYTWNLDIRESKRNIKFGENVFPTTQPPF